MRYSSVRVIFIFVVRRRDFERKVCDDVCDGERFEI